MRSFGNCVKHGATLVFISDAMGHKKHILQADYGEYARRIRTRSRFSGRLRKQPSSGAQAGSAPSSTITFCGPLQPRHLRNGPFLGMGA